jgi:hypothetical protein
MSGDLFLEPKTTQYGSHMIMTNVHKPTKIKYVNIDTRFRDEYNYLTNANYNITLPERITNVKSMKATNIEIPLSYYTISANLGNNCFSITNSGNTLTQVVTIPDNNYTATSLYSAITTAIGALSTATYVTVATDASGGTFIRTTQGTVTVNFAVDSIGLPDKYNIKSKLGWVLGFRNPSYTLTTAYTASESFVDLNGPRYLYLAIDDFNKTNQNSFINPLFTSMITKTNVLSRVSLNTSNTISAPGSNTIYSANIHSGFMVSDKRQYNGKVDILKLNVQLVNEVGVPIALNGMDFSFCLEIEHE